MHTIENEYLRISVAAKGAELTSLFHKQHKLEYMWSGDPAVWAKHSPVLFPIVGTLKDNTYYFDNKSYQLPRHGFARDAVFELVEQSNDMLSFSIEDNAQSKTVYPFGFRFTINYRLVSSELEVKYIVENRDNQQIYFSVGGHPAFAVPLVEGTQYEAYFLRFSQKEKAPRWMITKEGLIGSRTVDFLQEADIIPLKKELFYQDAIVLKHLKSDKISLLSDKTPHGIEFDFTGFPYLGLWAAKNADFVCIEPWCGIADSESTDQKIENKEGIQRLEVGAVFERAWKVAVF
jgi:galactose mutarotase-like enzyme